MTEAVMIYCIVLMGQIAISATEMASDGDLLHIPKVDFDNILPLGIVREATAEEVAAKKIDPIPSPEAEPRSEPEVDQSTEAPKETAAQKKKREAEEANAAKLLAEQEAAAAAKAERLAAEELANQNKEAA